MAKKKLTIEDVLVTKEEIPYEVPENWCWTRWGFLGDFIAGTGFKPKYQGFNNLEIPFYKVGSLKNIDSDGYICIDDNTINEDMRIELKAKIIPENSILFAKVGEAIKLNRRALAIKDCCIDNNTMSFQCNKNINYRYIYYWSKNIELYDYSNATTVPSIRKSDLEKIVVPLPPLVEQERIVNRIESLFEKVDKASELVEEAREGFEKRRAAILEKAFSGELTKSWRRNYGNLKNDIIDEIKEIYKQTLVNREFKNIQSMYDELQKLEPHNIQGWKHCYIGNIAKVSNGSTPSRKVPEYWEGDIPWVSSGEVKNNRIDYTKECITQDGFNNSSVKLLEKGSVLIAMIGEGKTRGQSSILDIDATINQNIAAIDLSHNKVLSEYVWYWLQFKYKQNRNVGMGTGPKALNCQRVRELDFVLPPIEEQREIVKILDRVINNENYIEENSDLTKYVDNIKKSILAKAFRGELGSHNLSEKSSIELLKEVL